MGKASRRKRKRVDDCEIQRVANCILGDIARHYGVDESIPLEEAGKSIRELIKAGFIQLTQDGDLIQLHVHPYYREDIPNRIRELNTP